MEAYNENIDLQTQEVIEGSDIAIALQIFIQSRKTRNSTVPQLSCYMNLTKYQCRMI